MNPEFRLVVSCLDCGQGGYFDIVANDLPQAQSFLKSVACPVADCRSIGRWQVLDSGHSDEAEMPSTRTH